MNETNTVGWFKDVLVMNAKEGAQAEDLPPDAEAALETLATSVFGVNTYDTEKDYYLVSKLVSMCKAILSKGPNYGGNTGVTYREYVTLINYHWFHGKIEWSTSIRKARFTRPSNIAWCQLTEGSMVYFVEAAYKTKTITHLTAQSDEVLRSFVEAVISFYDEYIHDRFMDTDGFETPDNPSDSAEMKQAKLREPVAEFIRSMEIVNSKATGNLNNHDLLQLARFLILTAMQTRLSLYPVRDDGLLTDSNMYAVFNEIVYRHNALPDMTHATELLDCAHKLFELIRIEQ